MTAAKAKAGGQPPKRPLKRSVPTINVEAYNQVVAKANLIDLRLTASRSEIKPAALDVDRTGWDLKVGDELVEWDVDEEKERLWGRIIFKAECVDGKRKPIIVEGDYLIIYAVEGKVDKRSASLFINRVARFACYPYFRTLFAALLGQASVVMPPLPVLKEPARRIRPPVRKISKTK
ncbi:hypothetical protein [Novosphingopyxis sp.]|uniref:hypothetical protein n=1 Tax=Novosphingopyxis sp. TaxID=2709690 RepID=UPI003B5B45B2